MTSRKDREYDVIIVGGGPAGIFAALEFSRGSKLRVLLLEKGADISERRCPARTAGSCAHCSSCDITTGWGGAGAFSDGKLTLTSEVGGWLGEYVDAATLQVLIAEVDRVYRDFGAPDRLYGDDQESLDRWVDAAALQGLRLVRSPVRHLGTERAAAVLAAMRAELENKVDICTDTAVARILTAGDAEAGASGGRRGRRRGRAWLGSPASRPRPERSAGARWLSSLRGGRDPPGSAMKPDVSGSLW